MSDYSYPDTSSSGPRLVSYERHDSVAAEYGSRVPNRYEGYESRAAPPERRTQRSYSFQRREEMSVSQVLRRTSNSVAPLTVESMSRSHPGERLRHDYDVVPREMNDVAYRGMPNSLLRYHDDDGRNVSYDGMRFYDPVQETDILGDDVSEEQSEVYGPGTYAPADDETSTSEEEEEEDPQLRELEERDNIVLKYEKGPESKDIDPWENPEFDVYAKMDRFGFVHKAPEEATEEERANRRRIAREVKRVNKWLAMEEAWKKGRLPKKLEERTWKGIPEKLRMKIWPRLLGANDMREAARPNLYQELLIRALLVSKEIKQIDLDINRTYRDHLAFRRRYDVKQQSLLNVLAAYSMYNTEVGYCQGMSQIAALFLMYLDEEDTFWCIHALMTGKKHTMHGFFVPGFPKLSRFEAHFKKVLKKYRPRVYKHLEKNDIPYIYLTKWWFGCFLDRVPFSLALRLWDVYILEGDPILLAMALNIMKMHEKSIRKLTMENFMDFIQTSLAADFRYSDDETMFSLREVLSKLRSDGLHVPPPPKPEDLAEVPTKALGPVLSRPIASIREELEEIKSRRSHAASYRGFRVYRL